MTKKDFILIAHAIYSVDTTNRMKKRFADAMANALLATNPQFDRARFVLACLEYKR